MGPLIGIACEFEAYEPRPGFDRAYSKLYHQYYEPLIAAGAHPVLLPVAKDPRAVLDVLPALDGVLLTGGDDFDGEHFGQETHPAATLTHARRASQELALANHLLHESKLPVLAICMGMQALAIADGGSIVQDIPTQLPNAIEHRKGARHVISIKPQSRLFQAAGGRCEVNSYHHQSVQRFGKALRIVAISEDGVIEAGEARDPDRFLLALQWHVELDTQAGRASGRIFDTFVEAAHAYHSGGGAKGLNRVQAAA